MDFLIFYSVKQFSKGHRMKKILILILTLTSFGFTKESFDSELTSKILNTFLSLCGFFSIVYAASQLKYHTDEIKANRVLNTKIANAKNKEVYLKFIAPHQRKIRTEIINLSRVYNNFDKNLLCRIVESTGIIFDDVQPSDICNKDCVGEYKFYSSIYLKFKELEPEVKNYFPSSYTIYHNFITSLDVVLMRQSRDQITEIWNDSTKLLKSFISSSYNLDTELRNVWN